VVEAKRKPVKFQKGGRKMEICQVHRKSYRKREGIARPKGFPGCEGGGMDDPVLKKTEKKEARPSNQQKKNVRREIKSDGTAEAP